MPQIRNRSAITKASAVIQPREISSPLGNPLRPPKCPCPSHRNHCHPHIDAVRRPKAPTGQAADTHVTSQHRRKPEQGPQLARQTHVVEAVADVALRDEEAVVRS